MQVNILSELVYFMFVSYNININFITIIFNDTNSIITCQNSEEWNNNTFISVIMTDGFY